MPPSRRALPGRREDVEANGGLSWRVPARSSAGAVPGVGQSAPDPAAPGAPDADERLDLLVALLKRDQTAPELTALRFALLSQDEALAGVVRAAARRQILANVLDRLEVMGLCPARRAGSAGTGDMRGQLLDLRAALDNRRQVLAAGLSEIISALNAAGIAPLVLKGAVSLLTGAPAWRAQRDIDLAVPRAQARRADAALRATGFRDLDGKAVSATHHHLQPLERPGLPAPVEIHLRLSGRRSAYHLPDRLLWRAATPARLGGGDVRLLRADHFLLFGLVHHHFQNLGAVFGTMSLKGLLEFADAQGSLSPQATGDLRATLAGRPRLAGAFELWTAAASVILGEPVLPGLAPSDLAMERAAHVRARLMQGAVAPRWQALRDDVAGSLDVLRRAPLGPATPAAAASACLRPLLESLTSRSGKHGRAKARKVAGVISEA